MMAEPTQYFEFTPNPLNRAQARRENPFLRCGPAEQSTVLRTIFFGSFPFAVPKKKILLLERIAQQKGKRGLL